MASGKSKRSGGRNSSGSPTGSPPMPPAPNQSRNREKAAQHHFQSDLASSVSSPETVSTGSSTSVHPVSPRSRSSKNKGNGTLASPTPANGSATITSDSNHPTNASPDVNALSATPRGEARRRRRKSTAFRRFIARVLLLYLGYSLIFVCPNLKDSSSDAVCDGIVRLQDWLRPYSDPVVERIDETYRTYGEPLVDQYGRPLYQQSQEYYDSVVQPSLKIASVKARESYDQFAAPHVNKAFDTLYTDNVKAHMNHAQSTFQVYQAQAQDHLNQARVWSKDTQDQAWKFHEAHVQPVVDKVSPHAKVAWDKASVGAGQVYDAASVMYNQHVNPHAQKTWAVVLEAVGNAKESFLTQTDEIWGTSYSKSKKRTAAERFYDSATENTRYAKERAQAAAAAAAKAAQDAAKAAQKKAHLGKKPEPEGVKDTILKKASEAEKIVEEYVDEAKEAIADTVKGAQKVAGEYSETIKAAVAAGMAAGGIKHASDSHHKVPSSHEVQKAVEEKGQGSQKMAEEFFENVAETVAKTAHDAQKAIVDEAEQIKHYADGKVKEAGKISEHIKQQVIEKARAAQEAVLRQAENVQETGTQFKDSVVGSASDAKDTVDKEVNAAIKAAKIKKHKLEMFAKQEAAAAKMAIKKKEREAKKAADDISHKAQKAFRAAEHEAETIKDKVVKATHDAQKAAQDQHEGAKKVVQDQIKHVEEVIEEEAEYIRKSAEGIVKDAKETVDRHTGQAQEHAAQQVKGTKDQVEKAKDFAAQKAKEAGDHIEQARVHANQKVKEAGDQADQVKGYANQKAKDAHDHIEHTKETVKHKAHDAHTASKASLAAMLAGIEATFGQFYSYEENETESLWNKLQSAIDEHLEAAKKSAHDLDKSNREAYESFESYVKDWSKETTGDVEDRISTLGQRSVQSIKTIGQRAENDQGAAKSKSKVLANNVEVYLSGLKDFLTDRLAASKETVASDLSVFKDTSSEDDEKTVREKLAQLEAAAKARLEETGSGARTKAHVLLKQVDDVWSQSEAKSREYLERTRELYKKAAEDAKASLKAATDSKEKVSESVNKNKKAAVEPKAKSDDDTIKSKTQLVKEHAQDAIHEATVNSHGILPNKNSDEPIGQVANDAEPNVRVAMEEPGSGHRHHRH